MKATKSQMNSTEFVREELQKNIDKKYRAFHASLVLGIGTFLGVRVPVLRQIAKQVAKDDYQSYIENADMSIYEECMIRGMLIGYAKLSKEEQRQQLREFVPYINNWAICDCCCTTYKFMKKNREEWFAFLNEYLQSTETYRIRFAVVCMLDFFIEEAYIDEVLQRLLQISSEEYYVKMAVAWALSMCFVKFPEKTESVLESAQLDEETRKKAVQKIRESLQVSKEEKARLKEKFTK